MGMRGNFEGTRNRVIDGCSRGGGRRIFYYMYFRRTKSGQPNLLWQIFGWQNSAANRWSSFNIMTQLTLYRMLYWILVKSNVCQQLSMVTVHIWASAEVKRIWMNEWVLKCNIKLVIWHSRTSRMRDVTVTPFGYTLDIFNKTEAVPVSFHVKYLWCKKMIIASRHLHLLSGIKQSCLSLASVRFRVSAIRRVNPKSRRATTQSEKWLVIICFIPVGLIRMNLD